MNAPLLPEVLLGLEEDPQTRLELATEAVLRYVWQSRWGDVLIEVRNGRAYVNGQVVEPTPRDERSITASASWYGSI